MAKKIVKHNVPEPQKLKDQKILGDFIRAARTNSDMTLEDAAALCRVSIKTMTNLENAKADIKFSTVLKVCEALGVTLRIEA
ncbi:helix-turn-helix domain-containing protein [Seleniivibrio woodruffii]|uniref:DNA-binding XRE family transcriptional regulator n=1 Tax=Seleniivibrio woodruffii TaxID=1078050 RepID=A0A4R1KCT8_9BACT|nr:helix-turn-helix transcriptional regulator [Seleniivibrio woodruffii]TCK62324.1 DNA-binding XRE family transcriptional regulator [Seleniivibrio woodruffii]TVZ34559.1 DNA-binding XRE family transcriptional regulator [Seleniivibrio woodruffii]